MKKASDLTFTKVLDKVRNDFLFFWGRNSAGECYVHIVEVAGSNPAGPKMHSLQL